MAATIGEIRGWFDEGVANGDSYLFIICDTFDHEDYPAYYKTEEEALVRKKNPGKMQMIMEIYDLAAPRDEQIKQYRCLAL